jgi:hypothetical protein
VTPEQERERWRLRNNAALTELEQIAIRVDNLKRFLEDTVGSRHFGVDISRKLGKKPARFDKRTLQFGKYTTPALPPPPSRIDWSLGFNINWSMMLNDSLGDCTEAAKGHAVQVWTLCNGRMVTVHDSTVLAAYKADAGYIPGDPSTDNGENELDTLNAWRQNGFGGVPLSAYAAINPQTLAHVQQGIYLFGCAYIGFNVPQSAMDQNAAGQVWDVVPDDGGIVGGHAVVVPMYDAPSNTLTCISWGMRQRLTWAFWQKYVDEAYVLLSPAWLARKGVDPSGFDMAQLQADLAAVTA